MAEVFGEISVVSVFRRQSTKNPLKTSGNIRSKLRGKLRKKIGTLSFCKSADRKNCVKISKSFSTGLWCVQGLGAGLVLAFEHSKLQEKKNNFSWKGRFYFLRAPIPGSKETCKLCKFNIARFLHKYWGSLAILTVFLVGNDNSARSFSDRNFLNPLGQLQGTLPQQLRRQQLQRRTLHKEQLHRKQLDREQLHKEQLHKEQLHKEQLDKEELRQEQLLREHLLREQLRQQHLPGRNLLRRDLPRREF